MKTLLKEGANLNPEIDEKTGHNLLKSIELSWKKIAPFWPLRNLIAVNPLRGFEDLPFDQAISDASVYFQTDSMPTEMEAVNRQTIKWLQVYFDQGQATIAMPDRELGLFKAWKNLAIHDRKMHQGDKLKKIWLNKLPDDPVLALAYCLKTLGIKRAQQDLFLTLLLTTLPGWASHMMYHAEWSPVSSYAQIKKQYLAMRAAMCCLVWPGAAKLIQWFEDSARNRKDVKPVLAEIERNEAKIKHELFSEYLSQKPSQKPNKTASAQLVFCIDVRSEPIRRVLEAKGQYETFGFAGFFGAPIAIKDPHTGDVQPSCPVLLKPSHTVTESHGCSEKAQRLDAREYKRLNAITRFYQACKYTFVAPFSVVETLGLTSGLWMMLRSFWPRQAMKLKRFLNAKVRSDKPVSLELDSIGFEEQCGYAEGLLRAIGLTDHFAPYVVLCGHGSTSENNIFATSLDCGACGGRQGTSNARLMSAILNRREIREYLASVGISIPTKTRFIPAKHDTTENRLEFFYNAEDMFANPSVLNKLLGDAANLAEAFNKVDLSSDMPQVKSANWAEVRPEWGLARNNCFIIGSRELTKQLNLNGRAFLHSYDPDADVDGSVLTVILTAPVIVAQWINTQYLMSTIDNVAYGAGSKITANVTGKFAVMQGNGSDIMHGLPLQSVYSTDDQQYHHPSRLNVLVNAPKARIAKIVSEQPLLQTLIKNRWLFVFCHEDQESLYEMNSDFHWKKVSGN